MPAHDSSPTSPDLAAARRAASRDTGATGLTHLSVDGISVSYPDRRVLTDVSFTARSGDRLGLVGENGTGKSTLVEAVAMAYGLNPEGGSTGAQHRTYESESGLSQHLRCLRGAGASRWGFFLRAETTRSFFTYLESNRLASTRDPYFHALSHGESFLALLDSSRFSGGGLFVLDEPESALSFTAQLRLLGQLIDMARTGTAQVLLSTHSPVLAALPGARLLELGDWGYRETTWDELEVVDHYRRFLDAPERYLRHLR